MAQRHSLGTQANRPTPTPRYRLKAPNARLPLRLLVDDEVIYGSLSRKMLLLPVGPPGGIEVRCGQTETQMETFMVCIPRIREKTILLWTLIGFASLSRPIRLRHPSPRLHHHH